MYVSKRVMGTWGPGLETKSPLMAKKTHWAGIKNVENSAVTGRKWGETILESLRNSHDEDIYNNNTFKSE